MKLLNYIKRHSLEQIAAATMEEFERIDDVHELQRLLAADSTPAEIRQKLTALETRFNQLLAGLFADGLDPEEIVEEQDPLQKFFDKLQALGLEKIKQLTEKESRALEAEMPAYQPLARGEERFGKEFKDLAIALGGRSMSFANSRLRAVADARIAYAENHPGTDTYKISWVGKKGIGQMVPKERGGDGNTHTFDVDAHSHLNFFDSDGQVYTAHGRTMKIGDYRYTKEAAGQGGDEYEMLVTLVPQEREAFYRKEPRDRLRSNDPMYNVEHVERSRAAATGGDGSLKVTPRPQGQRGVANG